MKKLLTGLFLFSGISFLTTAAAAGTLPASNCSPDGTSCSVYEDGNVLSLGFLAISGDVVLVDPSTGLVSDVFHIFNDVFDSGNGTGLGATAFLFSDNQGNLPTTLTANAVGVTESAVVVDSVNNLSETDYMNDGVLYRIFSNADVPEPSSVVLFCLGGLGLSFMAMKRRTA